MIDIPMGGGKSLIYQIFINSIKKLDPTARPTIVMPNSLVGQFTIYYMRNFPMADLIVLDNELTKEKREEILQNAANNSFDALIMPITTFQSLEAPKNVENELLENMISELEENIKSNNGDRISTYRLENKKENSKGWTQKNLDPLLDKLFDENNPNRPNWRTVIRWRQKYIKSNGDPTSLIAEHKKKGNRKKRIEGDEVFFEKALSRFLDAKRPKVSVAYQYYKDSILIENESIVDGEIPIISYTAFNHRIKSLPPYPIAVARHGKFKADQWFAYCSSHIPPTRILERVEIDHTPLDLILLDDELKIPIGRPYLTLVVDVFSSCVLGFHLSYKCPSYVSVAKAITHAIKPKSLDNIGIEFQHDWPCMGNLKI